MAQWAGHRLIDRPLGDAELLVEACAELVMDTAQKAQDLAAAGIGTVSGGRGGKMRERLARKGDVSSPKQKCLRLCRGNVDEALSS